MLTLKRSFLLKAFGTHHRHISLVTKRRLSCSIFLHPPIFLRSLALLQSVNANSVLKRLNSVMRCVDDNCIMLVLEPTDPGLQGHDLVHSTLQVDPERSHFSTEK